MGVLEAIGSNVPSFIKDVPNFPKCVSRWGSTTNHFLMGSQLKLWTLGVHMGVPKAIGLYVPNFIKDVPNFVTVVPNFIDTHRRYLKIYLD